MCENKGQKTIPIFVSHMGCPNDCAFCNQRTITGQTVAMTPEFAEQLICKSLETIHETDRVEIGFFGGSFTGIEDELQKAFLSIAKKYVDMGKVHAIRLSTRPDYIHKDVIEVLKHYGVTTVELGAQSMDDQVLFFNQRGHKAEDTYKASKLIKDAGIKLGLQMMTGLYQDTDEKTLETAQKIIELHPSCVRIYPTLVLKGTHLDAWYQAGKYQPQSLEEAVLLCVKLKKMFDAVQIPVIRMGLMASDNLRPEKDVVAGPYHPSFGELVQSEIYFQAILKELSCDAEILVHPRCISAFVGNGKCNIRKFRENGYNVRFTQNETIPCGAFQITKQKGGRTCG